MATYDKKWSLVPPEWISKPQDIMKVKEGSSVVFECTARGEPEPTVTIERKQGRTGHLLISFAWFWLRIASLVFKIRLWVEETYIIGRKVHDASVQVGCRLLQVPSWKWNWIQHREKLRTSCFRYWSCKYCIMLACFARHWIQYLVHSRNEALSQSTDWFRRKEERSIFHLRSWKGLFWNYC